MTRVFTGNTLAEVGYLRQVLEQSGIPCFIKNEQLGGALGEVPFLECMPELWVLDDAMVDWARELIDEQMSRTGNASSWRCRSCGETNEGQYAVCWSCGVSDEPL